MTYAETLHFLYHSLPVFQHIGGNAYKPGFGNITELEKELGDRTAVSGASMSQAQTAKAPSRT